MEIYVDKFNFNYLFVCIIKIMATKKISVNPEYFKLGKSKTLKKERKKKSARNSNYTENKELKMGLINKIKAHRKKEKEKEKEDRKEKKKETNSNSDSLQNDLNSSLDYLQSLSTKHKSKKEKRRERKMARKLERQRMLQQQQQQQQQITPQPIGYIVNDPNQQYSNTNQLVPPDPPYGILKHGKKPLFSTYNKTLKKPKFMQPQQNTTPTQPVYITPVQPNIHNTKSSETPSDNAKVSIHTDPFFERQQQLNQLKESFSTPKGGGNSHSHSHSHSRLKSSLLKPGKTLKKMKQLKTTTKRFIHLGKKNGRVGVLIKNQKTRKKILKDTNTLKKRPLSKVKDYLRKHNLIKIGSTAPEHIIRGIYENSFLSGDIYNKNVDMLLHNYLDK